MNNYKIKMKLLICRRISLPNRNSDRVTYQKIMSAGRRRIARDEGTDDIICRLPKDLSDIILERLPIRDAVRTSILSRKWRYLWTARTDLEFDKLFFETNFKFKPNAYYAYVILIHNILLHRIVPVLKFSLYIPGIWREYSKTHIDNWLLCLSRNRINELELVNVSLSPYKLPSCVFSSPNLKILNVTSCLFKPPNNCFEFAKLESLCFTNMSFVHVHDAYGSLPELQNLYFYSCRAIENFKISAPKLKWFVARLSYDVKSFSLDKGKFPKLASVGIEIGNEVYEQGRNSMQNSVKFFENLQDVKCVALDGAWLKSSAATLFQRRPSSMLHHLTSLGLYELKFDDVDQILCFLCLLRSSPSLQALNISGFNPKVTDFESVSKHLEAPGCMGWMLNLLHVKFVSVRCSKPVMLLVRSILARSPYLRFMNFEYVFDKNEELYISNMLMGFRRTSAKAEVIYSSRELASTKWAHRI